MNDPPDDHGAPLRDPRGPDGSAPVSARRGSEWAAVEPHLPGDRRPSAYRPRRLESRRRRGRLLGYLLVAVFAFVLGIGAGYARGYFSDDGEVGRTVTVVVPEGATLSDISERLVGQGVVKHARAFVIRAESDGYATKFKPGTYRFRQNEPYESLVAALVRGVEPPTVKVTVPEGTTLVQTGAILAKAVKGISAKSYVAAAAKTPPSFRLKGYKAGSTLEGLLFPATYEVRPGSTADGFVKQQLTAFDDSFAKVDLQRATKANLTPYDVVIIASMVEREARVADERPLVAAVIWNRLRIDMLLQIDATIQYALGETKPVLTFDDLKIDSPYNTYKFAGLPPTPIANPGLASLRAAADPAANDYLYYVARGDGSGRHYFSTDYQQFLADQQKAQANAQ